MTSKEFKFFETNLISIIKNVARKEIVSSPQYYTYTQPGYGHIAHSAYYNLHISYIADTGDLSRSQ